MFYQIQNFLQRELNDLINPDRVLIGGEEEDSIEALSQIYNNWVPKEKNPEN